jgi:hypothetical protein
MTQQSFLFTPPEIKMSKTICWIKPGETPLDVTRGHVMFGGE